MKLQRKRRGATADLVIETRGGVVAAVYSDQPHVRVVLIDWDEVEAGDGEVVGFYPTDRMRDIPRDTLGLVRRVITRD